MSGQPTQDIKQGPIEIDYNALALIVNYTIEKHIIDENGRVAEVIGRTNKVQRIKLHSLSPDKNMAKLADEIIRNCNRIIHPARAEELEQLLLKLQKHAAAHKDDAKPAGPSNDGEKSDSKKGQNEVKVKKSRSMEENTSNSRADRDEGRFQPPPEPQEIVLPPSNMADLDDYLELLYQVPSSNSNTRNKKDDGMSEQVRGTAMLLQLCKDDVMNLEQLIQNNTVMGALTRVLQEEFKKSIELTFNILRIFLSFSNFVEMHELMSNYRIGLLTMKAIEFECVRIEHRETEMNEKMTKLSAEIKAVKYNRNDMSEEEHTKYVLKLKRNKQKEEYYYGVMCRKQDKLLFVAFYILLNLAEDPTVERKMLKKDLINQLNLMLARKNADLLILTVTFLRKLSIIEENKEAMKKLNIVGKLARFIPCSSQPLVNNVLRLLFNLSFDKEMREQMIKYGLLPKLIKLMSTAAAFRGKILKILYHLSVDDRCKAMFGFTASPNSSNHHDAGGVGLILGMIVNFPQESLPKELAALAVNLTFAKANCTIMIQNKAVSKMVERLVSSKYKDPLLLKILRNLSLFTYKVQEEGEISSNIDYMYRGLWSPHIKSLIVTLVESDQHDVTIELLGLLNNITMIDLPTNQLWHRFVRDYNLISLLNKLLIPGMSQNDMILEVVMFTANIASDPEVCGLIVASNLIQLLLSMWREKGKDDMEILIQLIYTMYKLLKQEKSCEETLYGNRVMVTYLMEALDHKNNNIRKAADKVLELVIELDRKPNKEMGSLSNQIRKRRFESYNSKWLARVEAEDRSVAHNQHMLYHGQDAGDISYYNNDHYAAEDGASYGSYHGDEGLFDDRGQNEQIYRRQEFDESGSYDEQAITGYDRSYK